MIKFPKKNKNVFKILLSSIILYLLIFVITLSNNQQKSLYSSTYDIDLSEVEPVTLPDNGKFEENADFQPTFTVTPTPTITITPSPTKTTTVKPKPTATPTPAPSPPPLSGTCPVSTENCVPCFAGEPYCRTEPGEAAGYLGWSCQNNNPGNIRNASTDMSTDFKNIMMVNNGGVAACGVRYDSRGGSYFIFPTYSAGMTSLKAYIKGVNNGEHFAYVNATASNCPGTGTFTCGNCTLQQFFCKFAGSSTYAQSIASKMGGTVTTDTLLSWVVGNRLDDMANAIKQTEGFFTQ